jgi:glycosyltransferase involved in cell wall biosynthesis
VKSVLPPLLSRLRVWDKHAAERVDLFIANSEAVRRRIKKYYHRDSVVLHPPVDVEQFSISDAPKTYFLAGGRLVSYKRYDLCLEACNRLRVPLKIFGTGPMESLLRKQAGGTVEILGRVSNEERSRLFEQCIAYLHPQEEDFGITAVEALAAGRPVIAFHRGGALETVTEGLTGTFFREQIWEELADTLLHFDHTAFDPVRLKRSVDRFAPESFRRQVKALVENAWQEHRVRCDL